MRKNLPALIFSELHVEVLALDLQFSRLDDVIHFSLRPPTLQQLVWQNGSKICGFLLGQEKTVSPSSPRRLRSAALTFILQLTVISSKRHMGGRWAPLRNSSGRQKALFTCMRRRRSLREGGHLNESFQGERRLHTSRIVTRTSDGAPRRMALLIVHVS